MPPPLKNNHTPQHGNTSNRERLCRIILSSYVKISFPHGKQRLDTAQPPDPVTTKVSNRAPTSFAVHRLRGKMMTEFEATPASPAEGANCWAVPTTFTYLGRKSDLFLQPFMQRNPLSPLGGGAGSHCPAAASRSDNVPVPPLSPSLSSDVGLGTRACLGAAKVLLKGASSCPPCSASDLALTPLVQQSIHQMMLMN